MLVSVDSAEQWFAALRARRVKGTWRRQLAISSGDAGHARSFRRGAIVQSVPARPAADGVTLAFTQVLDVEEGRATSGVPSAVSSLTTWESHEPDDTTPVFGSDAIEYLLTLLDPEVASGLDLPTASQRALSRRPLHVTDEGLARLRRAIGELPVGSERAFVEGLAWLCWLLDGAFDVGTVHDGSLLTDPTLVDRLSLILAGDVFFDVLNGRILAPPIEPDARALDLMLGATGESFVFDPRAGHGRRERRPGIHWDDTNGNRRWPTDSTVGDPLDFERTSAFHDGRVLVGVRALECEARAYRETYYLVRADAHSDAEFRVRALHQESELVRVDSSFSGWAGPESGILCFDKSWSS
jgi:hypothetical protein